MTETGTDECAFCGQVHDEQEFMFLGTAMRVRPCPNMPKAWLAVGPDANGDLIIHGGLT